MSRNSQRGYDQGRRGQGGQGGRGWTPAYSSGGYGAGSNAHNPYEVQMPRFLEAITDATHAEDQSIIIMSNAASSINVMTERDQVMPPNSGFHVALFGNYTLDGIKVVIAISIESNTGNPCAGWDESTARALSHPAFQPFSWPMLRDTSASYADVKVYNGNEICSIGFSGAIAPTPT